eukprot:1321061-Ditylum_brightwellii.AAC.1
MKKQHKKLSPKTNLCYSLQKNRNTASKLLGPCYTTPVPWIQPLSKTSTAQEHNNLLHLNTPKNWHAG